MNKSLPQKGSIMTIDFPEALKDKALNAFAEYAGHYDSNDIKIQLKVDHTYRVASLCEQIGKAVGADPVFSWFLGLLHDIGRFEQLTRYGTFIDAKSVDHAELGADILFKEGVIENFIEPDRSDRCRLAETAIRLHNKLTLPDDLTEEQRLFCQVLRDADKCDIFRVLTEPPYDGRNQRIIEGASRGIVDPAGNAVMKCVFEHRCVPRTFVKSRFESLISQCCMVFELVYPVSRSIVRQQGYLDTLMNLPVENLVLEMQLSTLRKELEQAWQDAENR